jgi:hypothetical protein
MPILKEYSCAAHGPFEAFEAECPYGCSPRFVSQEFRTPVGTRSDVTAKTDKTFDALASDFGMTNMGNRGGESVMEHLRRSPQTRPTWGNVQHAAPGYSQRGEEAKKFAPAQVAGNVPVASWNLPKPQPVVVGRHRE